MLSLFGADPHPLRLRSDARGFFVVAESNTVIIPVKPVTNTPRCCL